MNLPRPVQTGEKMHLHDLKIFYLVQKKGFINPLHKCAKITGKISLELTTGTVTVNP